jgi:hypothetical protein
VSCRIEDVLPSTVFIVEGFVAVIAVERTFVGQRIVVMLSESFRRFEMFVTGLTLVRHGFNLVYHSCNFFSSDVCQRGDQKQYLCASMLIEGSELAGEILHERPVVKGV